MHFPIGTFKPIFVFNAFRFAKASNVHGESSAIVIDCDRFAALRPLLTSSLTPDNDKALFVVAVVVVVVVLPSQTTFQSRLLSSLF
jgi:hypothetical protein